MGGHPAVQEWDFEGSGRRLTVDGRLSSWLKCSLHLLLMPCLSLMSVALSAESKGAKPDFEGP